MQSYEEKMLYYAIFYSWGVRGIKRWSNFPRKEVIMEHRAVQNNNLHNCVMLFKSRNIFYYIYNNNNIIIILYII